MGRLELGRELLRRLAPGLVLALDAVRGLAGAPFLPLPDATLALPPFGLAGTLALSELPAVLALAAVPADRADVRARPAAARAGLAALAAVDREDDAARPGLADPVRVARPDVARRAVADAGRADRAGAAGLATDSVFAAEFRALAAVVMALVAVFMDCIAVDIVLADEVARVAAAVILVAAEVTLVAADETVLAAVADVGLEPAAELRAVRDRPAVARAVPVRAVLRAAVPLVLRLAVPLVLRAMVLRGLVAAVLPVLCAGLAPALRVERAAVLRADRAVVVRTDDLAPFARAVAVVLGRPAERLPALVLTDRVLLELAGLRRAVARAVVCTGTEFPPS